MDLKRGFKQTEIGLLPEDWEIKTIDQVAFVTSGKRLPKGKSLTNKVTLHPYIRVSDMKNGSISLDDISFVPDKVFPQIKNYRIYNEDIYISVAGTLGIVGKIPRELDGANLTENADRLTNISCSQDYLINVLKTTSIQSTIESIKTIGAQPKLALTRIRKFIIPLPPTITEQHAIAEALSDVDALIASLDALIAKKRAIKQGVMQELLTGKHRLPGFSGAREIISFVNHSILKARIGWQGLTTAEYLTSGNYYLVTGIDFKDGRINWSSCSYVEKKRYDQDTNIQLKTNDILITKDGTIGKVAYVEKLTTKATLNSGIFVIRPKNNKYYPLYLFYVLSSSIFDKFLRQLQAGSTINHLYQKDFINFKFTAPPLSEQKAIANVLFEFDQDIAALEQKLNKLKVVKQGMMQELLTGRIRLQGG